ncbi:MAG: hypothetical protein ACRC5A_07855, partial [Enterobacteriaceae bacterium]
QWKYDAKGQLLESHVAGQLQFRAAYDGSGRLLKLTDARGQVTDYGYDGQGNLVLERNSAGHTVQRTWNAQGQLTGETRFRVADPDGAGPGQPGAPATTRYLYDESGQRMRYSISAEGRVSEWRYDSQGRVTSQIHYLTAATGLTALPATAELEVWAGKQDLTRTLRTDNEYDLRGLLSRTTRYSKVDAKGAGVKDGSQTSQQYVYDQNGLLLSTVDSLGVVVK